MSAVITGVSAWTCGGICLADAALTTAIAIVAGTCTIGPLAAFGRRPAEHLPGASESIANRYSAIN